MRRDPLDVLTQRIAFETLCAADPLREDYPDIADDDWDEIVARLGVVLRPPDGREFARAYDELRKRAAWEARELAELKQRANRATTVEEFSRILAETVALAKEVAQREKNAHSR